MVLWNPVFWEFHRLKKLIFTLNWIHLLVSSPRKYKKIQKYHNRCILQTFCWSVSFDQISFENMVSKLIPSRSSHTGLKMSDATSFKRRFSVMILVLPEEPTASNECKVECFTSGWGRQKSDDAEIRRTMTNGHCIDNKRSRCEVKSITRFHHFLNLWL